MDKAHEPDGRRRRMRFVLAAALAMTVLASALPAEAAGGSTLTISQMSYGWEVRENPNYTGPCLQQGCGTSGQPYLLHTVIEFDLANVGTLNFTSLSLSMAGTVGSQSTTISGITADTSKHYTVDVTSLYPFPTLCILATGTATDGARVMSNRACANTSGMTP